MIQEDNPNQKWSKMRQLGPHIICDVKKILNVVYRLLDLHTDVVVFWILLVDVSFVQTFEK